MKNLIILLLLLSAPLYAQRRDFAGLDYISAVDMLKTVEYLSSESLEGRAGGSIGYFLAADYMAKEFLKLGLKPGVSNQIPKTTPYGNDDIQGRFNYKFFQYLNVEYNDITGPVKFNLINDNKIAKKYKLGTDFICRGFTGNGYANAQVVFCGYGISDDEGGYNDYNSIDVNGKIVMVFKQNPGWANGRYNNYSIRKKAWNAYDRGAVAIIYVSLPNDKNPQKPIGSVMDGEEPHLSDFPMIHADLNAAEDFVLKTRHTMKELQTVIDEKKSPNSIELLTTAEIEINAKYKPDAYTVNVAAILEGSDAQLKNEYLIISAHLDHVGQQAGEVYFPGANDNASGSAAVLELARAFSKGEKTKRSILFILYSNEESGLQGSKFYAENPLVPLENTVAAFNFDCISFGDGITLGNGLSNPALWNLAKQTDSLYKNQSGNITWKGGGADLEHLYKKNIPGIYFVTTNSYAHLHLPSDKPETLNLSLYEDLTKLAYLIISRVANGEYQKEEVLK